MFTDKAFVTVQAGRGGNGIVSFRRERYIDRGGPDGGDGGKGGDVIFVGERNLNTLRSFRHAQLLKAEDGHAGSKAKRHGKNGQDLIVHVPIGTEVKTVDGTLIGDITEHDQQLVVAQGGDGGYGNAHFTSSRRQAPRVAEKGEPGDSFEAELELKLLADVGLVGLPNAGKSTFLSVISNAKPAIADYPFTTVVPNLGVADIDQNSLLVADIPGLIEGASQGKGLGDDFLRHVERTKVLIHLIDVYSDDVARDYKIIRKELKDYKVDLSSHPSIVVLSKIEGLDDELLLAQKNELQTAMGTGEIYAMSSSAHVGVDEVLRATLEAVLAKRKRDAEAQEQSDDSVTVYTSEERFEDWHIEEIDENSYRVIGKKIERFARRTDFDNEWGIIRLKDIMHKMGILNELERKGAAPGARVSFGERSQRGELTL